MIIRPETPDDVETIRALITAAFEQAPHSSGTEAAIVDGLRMAGALSVSLVAEAQGRVVGHVAFSPVAVDGCAGWFGLGPVAVLPERQGVGIGEALIRNGLDRLRASGAEGCVVLGEPAYYRRFGFVSDGALSYGDVPREYLQWLAFRGARPRGEVAYHPAFETR